MSLLTRYGLGNVNRLLTVDNVVIETLVSTSLYPMVNRYNDLGGLDWRAKFCQDADEKIVEFDLLDTNKLDKIGPHEIPFYKGSTKGWYQEAYKYYGNAFGFDHEFYMKATASEYEDKVQKMFKYDQRRIRNEILKECLAPASLGRGFYNQTFGTGDSITTPPTYGTNSFLATHTHYLCTGAAAIANFDFISDMKQHIREHGEVSTYTVIANSTDITAMEKLASWIGTNRANISNPISDRYVNNGIQGEFDYMGCHFITNDWVKAGYVVMIATPSDGGKPFKFHQPTNAQWQGLLWMPGKNDAMFGKYPITDSYAMRLFAIRTWLRWCGVVKQITANAYYTAPTDFNT